MNGFAFSRNFAFHYKEIVNAKFQSNEEMVIHLMFSFKNLAEHYRKKTMAYKKFCFKLMTKKMKGKFMVDDEIREIIDEEVLKIFNKHRNTHVFES